MALPALVSVATALMVDVVPMSVLGNEKAPGSTVNCETAGAGAAPINDPVLELTDGVLTSGAAGDRGETRQLAASAIQESVKAKEGQRLREWSIGGSHM